MLSVDVFSWIGSLGFSEFWHGAKNPYHFVHGRARVFEDSLNLKKNLVNNFQ